MLKSILFSLILLVSACTTLPPVQQFPTKTQSVSSFKVENNHQQSLLFIQFDTQQWRWVQTDPLGAPIARVLLTKKGWQQDGFVMPNKQAQQLFSALANALNPNQPLFQLDENWKIHSQGNAFLITLPDQSEWQVEMLE